ncbi:MAG TPA: response regulator [Pyrinomonadaceae bacterium]|jgi:CheY-like chemotaxis protein|nr:response regulator [Pyrinomonadaceae bacterium]
MPNILIVDDSDIWRRLAKDILKQNGYRLIEADSGERALEIARDTPLDLVVMDYRMNSLDGLDASRCLREISGYEHVPIILITSDNFPGDCVQTPAPYVNGYIDKRHLIKELDDCVKLHLERDLSVA